MSKRARESSCPDSPGTVARRERRKSRPSRFDIGPNGERAEKISNYKPSFASMYGGQSSGNRGMCSRVSTGKKSSSRRVYIGGKGLAAPLEQEEIENFLRRTFQRTLAKIDIPMKNEPIVGIKMNPEKEYCFVEFKTDQLATICIMMSGVVFREEHVRINRPSDYTEGQGDFPGTSVPGVVLAVEGIPGLDPSIPVGPTSSAGISGIVEQSPNKVFVGGLPYNVLEPQLIELLQAFGPLKSLKLIKEPGVKDASKGYAFCEWKDPNVTKIAVEGLDGLEIQGKTITLRLSDGANSSPNRPNGGVPQEPMHAQDNAGNLNVAAALAAAGVPMNAGHSVPSHETDKTSSVSSKTQETGTESRVLMLLNMVTKEELHDDEEYEDIVEDIKGECEKHGTLLKIKMPRSGPHLCKTFLEYKTVEMSRTAKEALHGREFGDFIVVATFISVDEYLSV